ncbi:MAG: hypothetical protein ACFCVD_05915 [Nodosilinea sp.]
MTDFLANWGDLVLLAAIPGGLNIFVAMDELFRECRRLPFFQPYRSPGFWLWAFLQFTIPAVMFWLLVSLQQQPAVDLNLLGQALGFGLGFVVVLNSRTDIAALPTVDIKQLYNLLVKYAYRQIANSQTGQTTAFWADVETTLEQNPAGFKDGLRYLALYFDQDISLTEEEKQRYQTRIKDAMGLATEEEQVKAIRQLLGEVRRRDLPGALGRFGVAEALIRRYFPGRK